MTILVGIESSESITCDGVEIDDCAKNILRQALRENWHTSHDDEEIDKM